MLVQNTKKMLITVFTPTYNRAHTLGRLYRSLCNQTSKNFEWLVVDDGSTDETRDLIYSFIAEGHIPIRYIYKENGGLHTGYNVAYANIQTELSYCMDSDDYLPHDAIAIIEKEWSLVDHSKYAGLIGLAFNHDDMTPLGGLYPSDLKDCYFYELTYRHHHNGDTAPVLRTDLMRRVAPQLGFEGEKNFNPVYMIMQVCDQYPLHVVNQNLMIKEYQQTDSMSKAIFKQYINSPRSFAKMRILEMQLRHTTSRRRYMSAVHYVASCLIARDGGWLRHSPRRLLTLLAAPLGIVLYFYILFKARQ